MDFGPAATVSLEVLDSLCEIWSCFSSVMDFLLIAKRKCLDGPAGRWEMRLGF
jgi:hypothetical protein